MRKSLLVLSIFGLLLLIVAFMAVLFVTISGKPAISYVSQGGQPVEIPTQSELVEFLAGNLTNEHPYQPDGYNCVDFSLKLLRDMNWNGWLVTDLVRLSFSDTDIDHMMLRILTSDTGWVYVEPQTDGLWTPADGEQYWTLGHVDNIDFISLFDREDLK